MATSGRSSRCSSARWGTSRTSSAQGAFSLPPELPHGFRQGYGVLRSYAAYDYFAIYARLRVKASYWQRALLAKVKEKKMNKLDAAVTVGLVVPELPAPTADNRIEVNLEYWPGEVDGAEEIIFSITLRNGGTSPVTLETLGLLLGQSVVPFLQYIPGSARIAGTGWGFLRGLDFKTKYLSSWQHLEIAYGTPRPRLDPQDWVTFTLRTRLPSTATSQSRVGILESVPTPASQPVLVTSFLRGEESASTFESPRPLVSASAAVSLGGC